MKLKTLLLGSAAAMIAVTGARAADAVIVEPEPVEYVRVCDLYGSGFFYIPGTETCLKFDGYVRVDYTYNDFDAAGVSDGDQWQYRARFNIDARNETDYGTLRSQIRFQGDGNGGSNTLGFSQTSNPLTGRSIAGSVAQGDAFVGIDRALISLGGLRLGYSDSYTTTVHGYGLPVEKYDGYYGYDQAIFLDYTFAVAGFSVTAGVQDSVAHRVTRSMLPVTLSAVQETTSTLNTTSVLLTRVTSSVPPFRTFTKMQPTTASSKCPPTSHRLTVSRSPVSTSPTILAATATATQPAAFRATETIPGVLVRPTSSSTQWRSVPVTPMQMLVKPSLLSV